jgi:hypothetical protein
MEGGLIYTQILQKPRMLQIQGIKGEAVPGYGEPLTTQEIRHYTAFPKGLQPMDNFTSFTYCRHLRSGIRWPYTL